MPVSDKALRPIGPWPAGIDNVHKETSLVTTDKGVRIALREAVNVDIADDGKIETRGGYSLINSTVRGHSLWADMPFPYALFIDGGTQYATTFDATPITVRIHLPYREACYQRIGDRVYCSNSEENWVVNSDLTVQTWGVETPDGAPTLTAAAGGLPIGTYQVTVTFINSRGEESGADLASTVTLSAVGAISLSHIPQPIGSDVARVRLYATEANGDVFYFQRDVPVGMTSVTLSSVTNGVPLRTQFLEQMPAGDGLALLAARLYVMNEDGIFFSQSLRYGLYEPTENQIAIRRGKMLIAVGDGSDGAGLYVSDDSFTYWLGGPDPFLFRPKKVYSSAAVKGTARLVPGSMLGLETSEPVAYWLAENGVACVGMPGGSVMPLRENQSVAPAAERGATIFRDANGVRQIITSLSGGQQQGAAIGDSAIVEINTNGVPA